MALTKTQKQKIIKELDNILQTSVGMFFLDFSKIKAKEFLRLKQNLKKENNFLKVVKKTLFEIVLKNSKNPFIDRIQEIPGQLAVVFISNDEITPSKILHKFSQEHKELQILGGVVRDKYLKGDEIIELAKLPSREELLSKFIGSISAPISGFTNVLGYNIKGLLNILGGRIRTVIN